MTTYNFKDYIYPYRVYKSLMSAITDIRHLNRYKSILDSLDKQGKLDQIGFKMEDHRLFVGVNLNPELLMYTEDSQESVELKFIADDMKKYTNFLQNEGILDSIQAEYDRVYTDNFYGYIVQISYRKIINSSKIRYDISYLSIAASLILASGIALINFLL